MNWSGAAYLQNQGGLNEIQRQEREAALKKKREDSLGYQLGNMVKGAGKGLAKGALLAPLTGGLSIPAGLASGALSGGGIMSGAEQKALVTNAAMMAISKGASRYAQPPAQSDAGGMQEAQDAFAQGKISYQDMMDYRNKIGGGPGYMR